MPEFLSKFDRLSYPSSHVRYRQVLSAPFAGVWLWHCDWAGVCICAGHDFYHLDFEEVCIEVEVVPVWSWRCLLTRYNHRYQREVQTSEMFTTAGRSVKTGLVAAAVVSSWTWAATLLQSTTVCYEYGVSGPFFYASGLYSLVCASHRKKRQDN